MDDDGRLRDGFAFPAQGMDAPEGQRHGAASAHGDMVPAAGLQQASRVFGDHLGEGDLVLFQRRLLAFVVVHVAAHDDAYAVGIRLGNGPGEGLARLLEAGCILGADADRRDARDLGLGAVEQKGQEHFDGVLPAVAGEIFAEGGLPAEGLGQFGVHGHLAERGLPFAVGPYAKGASLAGVVGAQDNEALFQGDAGKGRHGG